MSRLLALQILRYKLKNKKISYDLLLIHSAFWKIIRRLMSHENRRQTLTKSGKMALSSESFNIKKKANLFSLRKNRISRIFLYFKKAKPYL